MFALKSTKNQQMRQSASNLSSKPQKFITKFTTFNSTQQPAHDSQITKSKIHINRAHVQ